MPDPDNRFSSIRLFAVLVCVVLTLPASASDATNAVTAPAWPHHQLEVVAGMLRADISGAAGSGTIIPAGPGSESPALLSPDRVDATGGGIEYTFNTGSRLPSWLDTNGGTSNLTFMVSWERYSGDDTVTRSVLPGGKETGLLFTRPPNPTGFFPGAAGLESTATIDIDFGRIEFGMQWLQSIAALPVRMHFRPQLKFGWTQFDYRITTRDTFNPAAVSPNDYRSERDQNMQQDIFDLQLGGEFGKNFGGRGQYSVFGNAGIVMYFLKASLSSFEYVTLAGITRLRWVGEGERNLFLGADFGAGMAWQVTPGWRTSVRASYSPKVPTATIMNPTSVTDPAPRSYVMADSKTQVTLLLAVGYGF